MRRDYILSETDFISVEAISSLRFWGAIVLVEVAAFFIAIFLVGYYLVLGFVPIYLIMAWYTGRRKAKIRGMPTQDIAKVRQFGYSVEIIPWDQFTQVRLKGRTLELWVQKKKYRWQIPKVLVDSVETFFGRLGTATSPKKSETIWTQLVAATTFSVGAVPDSNHAHGNDAETSSDQKHTIGCGRDRNYYPSWAYGVGLLRHDIRSSGNRIQLLLPLRRLRDPRLELQPTCEWVSGEGATSTSSFPFAWPSYETCSVTLTDFHATTPGFGLTVSPLPLTINPGQNASASLTMTMPNHAYSGPLEVSVTMWLNC